MNEISEYVDSSGILLVSATREVGIPKFAVYNFIKENRFERVGCGIYASPDAWADENYILSLRCPQAVFSHDEALFHYGLVDHEPQKPTITIYSGYGTGRLNKDGVGVFTVKRELLEIGKTEVSTAMGHRIPMYNPERTICDLVRSRSNFEIQDFQTALKTYIAKKDKDLRLLMQYAALFHVDNLIRKYMEVML